MFFKYFGDESDAVPIDSNPDVLAEVSRQMGIGIRVSQGAIRSRRSLTL